MAAGAASSGDVVPYVTDLTGLSTGVDRMSTGTGRRRFSAERAARYQVPPLGVFVWVVLRGELE
jgi:hypothetical protein